MTRIWKAVEPLLKDVMDKQRETMSGFRDFGFMGRPNRPDAAPGGPGGGTPDPSADALRTALSSQDTPAADIKAKLDDLRKARKQKEKDLQNSRDALRKVLSVRQEAQLVLRGILD